MRFDKPRYIDRFVKSPAAVTLNSGEAVSVYSISDGLTEDEKNEWARHIRAHFIKDEDVAGGAASNNITTQEYMENLVLPSVTEHAKDVSGNFGEIVFCDFIEFILGYAVPRYKLYENPPGQPTQGIDIVAYKKHPTDKKKDCVLYAEVKAILSKSGYVTLQKAINDIDGRKKKHFALALDTARRRLKSMGEEAESDEIARFQDSENIPIRKLFAGLITQSATCNSSDFLATDDYVGVSIAAGSVIEAHVIHASVLWELAKDLWRRACSL